MLLKLKLKIYKGVKLKLIITLLAITPIFLFANEEAKEGTDIVARVINFAIFAGILYYLIAGKIRDFFTGRTKEIADKLSSVETKVKETKELKLSATKKLEESEKEAKEIVELAKKEAELQVAKLKEEFTHDIKNLEKSYESKKEVLEKKMSATVVDSVVDELFGQDGVSLEADDLINIVSKKVA